MKPGRIIGIAGLGAMAACGTPDAALSGRTAGGANPALGPAAPIRFEGVTYTAGVTRGPDGLRATAEGARPVAGDMVSVMRLGAPLNYAEGKLAKDVARLTCESRGGRYDGTAHGRFAGDGVWQFAGACT